MNNNRNPGFGWGWGIWFSSVYIGHFTFSPRPVQKASEKKTAAHHTPFLCPGLGEPWCMFSPNEGWIWAASACFYLFLTDSHKADIPLCWAKRMLNSEVGASGAGPAAELTSLSLSLWATTSISQRSIRAYRATWIWGSEERLWLSN